MYWGEKIRKGETPPPKERSERGQVQFLHRPFTLLVPGIAGKLFFVKIAWQGDNDLSLYMRFYCKTI